MLLLVPPAHCRETCYSFPSLLDRFSSSLFATPHITPRVCRSHRRWLDFISLLNLSSWFLFARSQFRARTLFTMTDTCSSLIFLPVFVVLFAIAPLADRNSVPATIKCVFGCLSTSPIDSIARWDLFRPKKTFAAWLRLVGGYFYVLLL